MSAPPLVQRAGDAVLEIDLEHGGRLRSLRVRGEELLRTEGPTPLSWGSYPMAPWAGRVRNGRFAFAGREHALPTPHGAHAIHGTVLDRPWRVESDGDRHTIVTELGDGWPFRGFARQRIRLGDARLELRLEVHALDEPFPASCGWHPWFRRRLTRGEPARVAVDAGFVEALEDGMPTGRRLPPPPAPRDDVYGDVRWPVAVTWPGALQLTVDSPCPYAVIFDERPEGLCVEPWSAPPNALNDDTATIVAPGAPLVAECTWRWAAAG